LINVAGGESQQPIAAIDEPVLPAVVLSQAFPVDAAVILEDESVLWVKQIGPAEWAPLLILE